MSSTRWHAVVPPDGRSAPSAFDCLMKNNRKLAASLCVPRHSSLRSWAWRKVLVPALLTRSFVLPNGVLTELSSAAVSSKPGNAGGDFNRSSSTQSAPLRRSRSPRPQSRSLREDAISEDSPIQALRGPWSLVRRHHFTVARQRPTQ